jgi:hypothetical protein
MYKFTYHEEGERGEFVRRTRTICIHSEGRPGIGSKSIAKVKLRTKGGQECEGVFCVDALGSRSGEIIAHKSHIPFANGTEVTLDIREATATECIEWLKKNDDPERKAFGHILETAVTTEAEAKRLQSLSVENLTLAEQTFRVASQTYEDARVAAIEARKDKAAGWFIGAAGFIFGALLDVGLIEEKTGYDIPIAFIIALCGLATALILTAPKLGSMLLRNG